MTIFAADARGLAVDVLIPVYNGAEWLARSLASIQRQTCDNLCIHVVDDGSTDRTPQILAEIAANDPRIRTYRKPNGGIVDALNFGLIRCSANWIARHDADDIAYPQRFERQLEYLIAHPSCVAVGGVARHIDAAGHDLGTSTELRPPSEADASWLPAREPYLMHPFMMARRDAIMAVGGYRHSSHSEDSDLYWRLSAIGTLHNLPDVLGEYRMHGASISSGSIRNGRLMAVGSQLAALSARRRMAGKADLDFDRTLAVARRDVDSLRAITDLAAAALEPGERVAFEAAVAAKLLELAAYLPYELDPQDVRFIARALRAPGLPMRRANRTELSTVLTRTAVRVCLQGRLRDASHLLPRRRLPQFLARLLWTIGFPRPARQTLRAVLRRLGTRVA